MRVAVTGAAGMIGRKLTDRLAVDGHLGGVGLDRLSLFDVVEPATPEGWTGGSTASCSTWRHRRRATLWWLTGRR